MNKLKRNEEWKRREIRKIEIKINTKKKKKLRTAASHDNEIKKEGIERKNEKGMEIKKREKTKK